MKISSKISIFVLLFLAFAVAVSIYSFLTEQRKSENLTAEKEALITEIQSNMSRESDGLSVWTKIQNVTVSYKFRINETEFERKENFSRDYAENFKIGENAKICYNPQNYSELKLVEKKFVCGK